MESTFEKFDRGRLCLPVGEDDKSFAELEWLRHPTFEGVMLKNLVTAEETGGAFSCCLVKIAPGKKIGCHVHESQTEIHEVVGGSGVCVNNGRTIEYSPGVISLISQNTLHEVEAGGEGLYLFAKFISALV